MIGCGCNERIGIDINSYQLFQELKKWRLILPIAELFAGDHVCLDYRKKDITDKYGLELEGIKA